MLKLYWANISGLSLNTYNIPLSEYRKNDLAKSKPELKKRQSLGAELLLINAVKEVYPEVDLPFEIECNENGKPAFVNIPVCFSLSHSGDFVACAVSDEAVGIDIEYGLKERCSIAKRFFSLSEQKKIADASDRDSCFAKIWTAKESAVKLLGIGLSQGLKKALVSDGTVYIENENRNLGLIQFIQDKLWFSVCTVRKQEDIEITEIVLN